MKNTQQPFQQVLVPFKHSSFFFFFFFPFQGWLHLQHMEVPWLGVQSELQLPWHCSGCGIGCRRGLDPTLLWLWPAAVAPIQPLVWEPPHAASATLKSKKEVY